MSTRIWLLAGAALAASVTAAAAQFSVYAEPGFGYKPDRPGTRPAVRSRAATQPYYRWVDPRTGQPYNLASPAYCATAFDPRTGRC